jgi:hypothetical protein
MGHVCSSPARGYARYFLNRFAAATICVQQQTQRGWERGDVDDYEVFRPARPFFCDVSQQSGRAVGTRRPDQRATRWEPQFCLLPATARRSHTDVSTDIEGGQR